MKKNILNNLQKHLLKAIGYSELGKLHTWGGGTALAYRLNHRISEDLDFFSLDLHPDELILSEINKIKKKLNLSGIKAIKKQNRYLFNLQKARQNLKLEFIYFPFQPLAKPQKNAEFNLRLDSTIDAAVNKLFALYERAEPKDIFDLYYLFTVKKYNLQNLIKKIEKKFGIEIDKVNLNNQTNKALDRLADLAPLMIKKVDQQKIKQMFQKNTNKYLKSILMF